MGFLLLSKGCVPGPRDFAFVSGLAFHSGCSGRMLLHLSPTCLPLVVARCICFPLVSHSGSHSGCSGPHAFFPNRFTCMGFFLLLSKGCIPGPHDFAFVSGLAHSGCSGRMLLHLSPTCLPLVSRLSPTLGELAACCCICFPLVSHSGSHSGCSGPHAFTLVCHLSFTLVSHSGWSGPRDFTLVSHTCLPIWVLGAA